MFLRTEILMRTAAEIAQEAAVRTLRRILEKTPGVIPEPISEVLV